MQARRMAVNLLLFLACQSRFGHQWASVDIHYLEKCRKIGGESEAQTYSPERTKTCQLQQWVLVALWEVMGSQHCPIAPALTSLSKTLPITCPWSPAAQREASLHLLLPTSLREITCYDSTVKILAMTCFV